VGNLYDAIRTDPNRLPAKADPDRPVNAYYLHWLAATHDMIVFAWGRNADPGHARAVASRVWRHCNRRGGTVAALGWTANDHPRPPLYLRSDTPLQPLTAGAHPGFVDVADRRWGQLMADTSDLDDAAQPDSHRWSA
jgi:hypothetical protein